MQVLFILNIITTYGGDFIQIKELFHILSITIKNYKKRKTNNFETTPLGIDLMIKDLGSKFGTMKYIKDSIEALIELKACEKYEEKILNDESKKKYRNTEDKNDENGLILYEGMLIKAEKDIRKHIILIALIYFEYCLYL